MIAELPILSSRRFWKIGILLVLLLISSVILLTPNVISAESCGNGNLQCLSHHNGDGSVDACDITLTKLCILHPEKYLPESYPGWNANEDSMGQ